MSRENIAVIKHTLLLAQKEFVTGFSGLECGKDKHQTVMGSTLLASAVMSIIISLFKLNVLFTI